MELDQMVMKQRESTMIGLEDCKWRVVYFNSNKRIQMVQFMQNLELLGFQFNP